MAFLILSVLGFFNLLTADVFPNLLPPSSSTPNYSQPWEPVTPPVPEPQPEPEPYIPAYEPTALCVDGTLSYAENHQGACSHHRGVSVWYQ